jgi:hypothetical protein
VKTRWTWITGWVSLVLLWALRASAAPVVDTVKVDLNPLIDAAVHSPQQFAVNVHHPISISRQGTLRQRDCQRFGHLRRTAGNDSEREDAHCDSLRDSGDGECRSEFRTDVELHERKRMFCLGR